MAKKRDEKVPLWRRISIGRIISTLFLILLVFILFSFFGLVSVLFLGPIPTGNIAVIPIDGVISGGNSDYGGVTSSARVTELIKDIEENDGIKAIILEINSGGGSAVASDEIAEAVKNAEKPTVAVIREIGTSGAYWIASASDKIYANRMSITGSIGVIGSYLEFARLLDDYNITYRRIVSGEHKDMGSPFKEMTTEEEEIFQESVDKIHNYFVMAVAENRNLPEENVKQIATGRFVLGAEALGLGLVDELGSMQDAVEYLEEMLNITADLAHYKSRASFYDFLSSTRNGAISGLTTLQNADRGLNLQT